MTTACIITGASRGFGAALAQAWAAAQPDSMLVLVARNSEALESTRIALISHHPDMDIHCVPADLSNVAALEASMDAIFAPVTSASAGHVDRLVVISNAGSLGPLQGTAAYTSQSQISRLAAELHLNVVAHIALQARTAAVAAAVCSAAADAQPSVFINISSLAAVQAFPTWASYCVAKAGRDMAAGVAAAESVADAPSHCGSGGDTGSQQLRLLSWAPGPMATDMMSEIQTLPGCSRDVQAWAVKAGANSGQGCVPADVSAQRAILLAQQPALWASGSHIDVYDEVPGAPPAPKQPEL